MKAHFKQVTSNDRPNQVQPELTLFIVGDEEYIFCPIRKKAYKVNSKPEEVVRQMWLYRLKTQYGYEFTQISVEVNVIVGSSEAKKAADIVVYTDSKKSTPRIFIEVKKPKRKDGIEQLKVYMNATGCRIGLWSNGESPSVYLLRMEPKADQEEVEWRELRNIPAKNESLADIDSAITRRELQPTTDFLSILKDCEDYIKAHEGSDPFDELFKLIFAKLFDERTNLKNDSSKAFFRIGVFEAPEDARIRISKLFENAKGRWSGVFNEGEAINLENESLAYSISALQRAYLLKSDADILGTAFEVMINPGMKGDKGQYFTPRHVIKMCIDLLDPNDRETFFDPACGSGGFLVGAMEHVFKKIDSERDDENEKLENKKDYGSECIYGLDYDTKIAKVAKAYMLIWGDGRSNISVCDALNENNWNNNTLSKFTTKADGKLKLRQFNVIATNPPFAGSISKEDTLTKYDLAYKPTKSGSRKRVNKLTRDRLFIERCLKMLTSNGRMAIVLPRGILKNYNDEYTRRYILQRAKIIAVIGLGGDMFKPFTNTKTCVLILQKRSEMLESVEEEIENPRIVYAVTEKSGKDKSGRLIIDRQSKVVSDLDEITTFIKSKISFD